MRLASRMSRLGTETAFEVLSRARSLEQLGRNIIHLEIGEPDELIVTDLNMPEMDGISFIREVRSRDDLRHLPIVMLTTGAEEKKKQEGRTAGASGWVSKPFNAGQLLAAIRKCF